MFTSLWIARDKDGSLNLFSKQPYRDDNQWVIDEIIYDDDFGIGKYMYLEKEDFPNLKWEDNPVKVRLMDIK